MKTSENEYQVHQPVQQTVLVRKKLMKRCLFDGIVVIMLIIATACSSKTSHSAQTEESDSAQTEIQNQLTPVYNGDRSFFGLKGKVKTLTFSIRYTPEFLGEDAEGIYRDVKGVSVVFDIRGYLIQIGMNDSLCYRFSPTDKDGEFTINPVPEIMNGCNPTTVIHQMEHNKYCLIMRSVSYDMDGNPQTNNCIEWECVEDGKERVSFIATNLFTDLLPVYASNYLQCFFDYDADESPYPGRIQIRMAYGGDDIYYPFYVKYI